VAQRHMDRLTSFDTSFLANEKSNGHMAIGAVLVCEGEPPSHEEFLASIRSRLHLLPRLRQRLSYPPLGLGRPFWVDHAEFDIHEHVSRKVLDAPGSDEQFRTAVAETFTPPLDRSRPLWELCLVEGMENDRFAIVYKTHHAMADGISAVDIGVLLFDVEPTTEPVPEPAPWEPKQAPSRLALIGHAGRGFGQMFARAGRWLAAAFRKPRRAAKRASDGIIGLWEVTWNLAKPAPKVPLNVDISPHRLFYGARCDLDEFKELKNVLGATVNDVTLAVTAGALRRWMLDRELETEGVELQALVPVSIRTEDQHGELGNKLTAMRGPLPVGIADPIERVRFVSKAMDDLKASKQPLGAEAIWGLNDWFRDFAPPLLLGPTAAINFSTRLFNLLVTNFPGPQIPFYVRGRELVEVYPVGFLARRHALAIAIISYNGAIGFGLLGDRDAMADIDRIGAYIEQGVEELRLAAGIASPDDGDELAGDPRPGAASGPNGFVRG
jgi:diacylglycerol O-acyltransferase / wax synthase